MRGENDRNVLRLFHYSLLCPSQSGSSTALPVDNVGPGPTLTFLHGSTSPLFVLQKSMSSKTSCFLPIFRPLSLVSHSISSHRARLVASICELAPHITYITFVQSHANQRNFSDCAEHQNQKSAIVHDFQKNEKSPFCKRQKSFVLGKKRASRMKLKPQILDKNAYLPSCTPSRIWL